MVDGCFVTLNWAGGNDYSKYTRNIYLYTNDTPHSHSLDVQIVCWWHCWGWHGWDVYGLLYANDPKWNIWLTCDHDGEGVWPGEELVLPPPPVHHEADVEAEHEGEGDVGQVVAAVQPQRLECLTSGFPSEIKFLSNSFIEFLNCLLNKYISPKTFWLYNRNL